MWWHFKIKISDSTVHATGKLGLCIILASVLLNNGRSPPNLCKKKSSLVLFLFEKVSPNTFITFCSHPSWCIQLLEWVAVGGTVLHHRQVYAHSVSLITNSAGSKVIHSAPIITMTPCLLAVQCQASGRGFDGCHCGALFTFPPPLQLSVIIPFPSIS